MKSGRGLLFAIVLLLITGCSSGTWEDDEDNWERIYNQEKPDHVKVVHSWYWRSPHWTYEFEFYLETEPNKQILEAYMSAGDLFQVKDPIQAPEYELYPSEKPKWFVPKSLDKYEVWKGTWNG